VIEKQTGLNFFSELPQDVQDRVEEGTASNMWQ